MASVYSMRPCVYEPCFKVSVCLHEPLWNNTNDSSNISIEMLSLCVVLEQMYSNDQNELQKQRSCLKKKFSNTSKAQRYFGHLSRLNQLMVLCKQIANDVALGNHKYIAHQLALLHQLLNHLCSGDTLVNIKTDIERRFRNLKSAVESQKRKAKPVLPQEYQNWLQDTASSLLDIIMDFSLELHQPLLPAIGFLQQSHRTESIS